MLDTASRRLLLATAAGAAIMLGEPAFGLELAPCRLDAGPTLGTAEARCGRFEVAENPDDPDGRKIELEVALVPALSVEPQPDPFVLLAGGPGQSAIDAYLQVGGAFNLIRQHRPILLVDQRGTGRSNPLTCSGSDALVDTAGFDVDAIVEETLNCLAGFDADTAYYTTSVAIQDLDAVREALGFEQLNLWGGSYGTRVAMHYMKRYPEHTRSVILDAVVPPDYVLGPAVGLDAQRSLDILFSRCAESSACADAFPDLPQTFLALRQRLADSPVTVTIPDPRDGSLVERRIDDAAVGGVIRMASYSPATRALIPLMISEAEAGRYTMVAAQSALIEAQMETVIAIGMHFSVVCSEDAPRFDLDGGIAQSLAATYLGSAQYDVLRSVCSEWPRGPVDDDFFEPVTSDVPVLLLSGSADPITPPEYAERATATLSNARHIVAPGQGHIVSGAGCMPKLIGEFIDTTDAEALDASCVDKLAAMPFFVTPVGPTP